MRFDVDTTSAIPIYAQLIAQVKQALATGVLRPGDSLPSLRELATELRVNPMTISRAYREMEQLGMVTTVHGRGSCISADAVNRGENYRGEALAQAVDRLLVEAFQLGATPEELRAVLEERLRGLPKQPGSVEAGTEESITHG